MEEVLVSDSGLKRARSNENNKNGNDPSSDSGKNPECFLVILTSVYGETENYPAQYAAWDKLTKKQRKAIHRSIPETRAQMNIPGCDKDHDFGQGQDNEGVDHILPGNIWKSIDNDKDLRAFTRAHHCETTVAYLNE